MDTSSSTIQLCVNGTRAKFEHRNENVYLLCQQAWEARTNNYEACIATHYVALFQDSSEESLHWNQIVLDRVEAFNDERVRGFYPSLYLCLWKSYAELGDQVNTEKYYNLAAELGINHTG